MSWQRILVRATNWVGDAVMSLPALHALRAQFPQATISILARPWVAELYGREPFCDELIPYTAPKGWKGLGSKWTAAAALGKRGFDCAILLQNAFEAAAVVRLAGIPERIGYSRDGRGALLTRAIAVPRKGEIPAHQRFYYLELLKRAGILSSYPANPPSGLSGAAKAAVSGRVLFEQRRIDGPVIGVSPGAAYGTAKQWLPERFAEAAAKLANATGATVAIFGSKEEVALCEQVRQEAASRGVTAYNFAGATTLGEFVDMTAACLAYLTNDSGGMHVASALGIPTVAIFGATDHVATGPVEGRSVVVREPVECSPCLRRECPIDHRCMTRVDANRVVRAALTLIESKNPR